MDELKANGAYEIDEASKAALNELMYGAWASEEDCAAEIRRAWNEESYLIDPHTAVAMKAMRDYRAETGDERPCVVASTASPFKFGRAVSAALGMPTDADDFTLCARLSEKTGWAVPQAISELPTLPVRHRAVCAPEDMLTALMKEIGRP